MEEKTIISFQKTDKNQEEIAFHDIGTADYMEAWQYQQKLFDQVLELKNKGSEKMLHHLIFCQHPHVYTLGKSGKEQNLLINYIQLQARNATFYKIDRGGDITYHGPGQLVGYPILSLTNLGLGLKEYIYKVEEAIILAIAAYGIKAERLQGATGVWIDTETPGKTRKICAIGVKSSHWVTMHGFALNVNTDLSYFGHINPCGFTDKSVTSMEKELNKPLNFEEVEKVVLSKLLQVFGFIS
ncbi:MAG TPA: lipoyl(octanoyl) transferase LipB [Bacteroidales bacterium]|nr:lipoyl(octanoyl) transferase LipB [Bacteroidales bacterium]